MFRRSACSIRAFRSVKRPTIIVMTARHLDKSTPFSSAILTPSIAALVDAMIWGSVKHTVVFVALALEAVTMKESKRSTSS